MSAENQKRRNEQEPAIRSNMAFYLLGIMSGIISDVKKNPNNIESVNNLRYFLSYMAADISHESKDHDTNFRPMDTSSSGITSYICGLAQGLKINPKITWVEHEDPLLRQTLLSDSPLDSDSVNKVAYYNGGHYVQWVMPQADAYWKCEDTDKLVHLSLVALEEIFHITQQHGEVIKLHTIGCEFDMADNREEVFMHLVGRLRETDVTNIFITAMPEMVEENWSWYADRKGNTRSEKHFPLDPSAAYMIGYLVAELTDQQKDFMAGVLLNMPEYLAKNPDARREYFANHLVLGTMADYFERVYVGGEEKVGKEGLDQLLKYELTSGMSRLFLINCVELMRKHGKNWKEVLDEGNWEPEDEKHKHFGTQALDIFVNFFNREPGWFSYLFKRKPLIPAKLRRQKLKDADQMIAKLAKSL